MILYAVSIGMSHKECPLFTENSSDSNVPSKKRYIHLLPQFRTCDLFGQNSLGQQSLGCWEARLHVSVSKKKMCTSSSRPAQTIKKERENFLFNINNHQPSSTNARIFKTCCFRCLQVQFLPPHPAGWLGSSPPLN